MLEQQIAELNKNLTVLIQALENLKAPDRIPASNPDQLELPLDNPNEPEVTAQPEPTEEKKVTVTDVQEALVSFSGVHGKQAARDVLAKFKAKKVGDLNKDQYQEVIDEINAASQEKAA